VFLSTLSTGEKDWLINSKIVSNFQSGFVKNKKKIDKIERRDNLREREEGVFIDFWTFTKRPCFYK